MADLGADRLRRMADMDAERQRELERRERIATAVLAGIMADSEVDPEGEGERRDLANFAVEMADALIEALEA